MAYLDINFRSECLIRNVTFKMILPNDMPLPEGKTEDEPIKTIFLLHGYTGSAGNWIPEYLIEKYHCAVVMPNGENGFYLDGLSTGHKFCTFLGEELVNYVRKTFHIALSAENTFIMGMSMGGFGSLHTAFAYPETFGKIGAMSSALIVQGIAGMKPGSDNGVANYDYYRECFGDLDTVLESRNNPETLVDELLTQGKKIPEIYMCCGTEDFLIEPNRAFHQFLLDKKIEHQYIESKGVHDMVFWNEYTEKILKWMFEE